MKGPLDRTKVVVRNLPPAITQPAFTEQIDGAFGGRYNWVSFRQGKTRLGSFFSPFFNKDFTFLPTFFINSKFWVVLFILSS